MRVGAGEIGLDHQLGDLRGIVGGQADGAQRVGDELRIAGAGTRRASAGTSMATDQRAARVSFGAPNSSIARPPKMVALSACGTLQGADLPGDSSVPMS